MQLLPTGIGPESVLAIPSRDLVITANEGDEGDGTISIFKGIAGVWDGTREQPQLESSFRNPWGALSGFAADLQHSATIGLSEITLLNTNQFGEDVYAVIERDNRYGARATFKRVYKFTLPTVSCAAGATITDCSTSGALISKTLFEDVLEQFFPYEKVESLAITRHGDVWVGLDNDGGEVESRVVKIRDSGKN